jgi:D-alanine-D-alanine ligase
MASRTVGPVADLERHLPNDWWGTLFNALYLKTDGDVVENDLNTKEEVDLLIAATGIGPTDRVLDLCCGQGRHCLELARRGFRHVTGVDRSRYLVRLARQRAKKLGLEVAFREGEARKFRMPDNSVDCLAIMGNSFGYFDRSEDDETVLARVRNVLVSHGTLALDLADGEWLRSHFEPRSWEWIDQSQLVCRERSLSHDGSRLISREVVIDAEKGVIADQFYAERLYDRATVEGLLERCGFLNVRFHDTVEAHSDRDQDLGMMAHRMFLTAEAPRKVAPVTKGAAEALDVAVLLGDPRLASADKLTGRFGPEDLATVEKLKTALSELPQYKFRYLDNHLTVLKELRRNPPALILNLCDEGFNNEAVKELHLPAYLEMLDIPYTGAAPACLALCYNKNWIGSIASGLDIPVPLETYVDTDDLSATIPSIFPALIKPSYGDSSVGITEQSVVRSPSEAVAYLGEMRKKLGARPMLIQEYLDGSEYTVCLIGNPGQGLTALPILEVDYSALPDDLPPILSYASKWQPDSPYWNDIRYRETEADEAVQRRMIDYSMRLFERTGCRDYARFDFRANRAGEPKLLEVNPNPGWCWDGKVNLMAGMAGKRYSELLNMILEAAQERVHARLGAETIRQAV